MQCKSENSWVSRILYLATSSFQNFRINTNFLMHSCILCEVRFWLAPLLIKVPYLIKALWKPRLEPRQAAHLDHIRYKEFLRGEDVSPDVLPLNTPVWVCLCLFQSLSVIRTESSSGYSVHPHLFQALFDSNQVVFILSSSFFCLAKVVYICNIIEYFSWWWKGAHGMICA